MLQITRWKVTLILLVVLAAIVMAAPNMFSAATVNAWPAWLPRSQVVLGLDLQGGAYLLYEVDRTDYVQKRLRTLVSDVRTAMLESPRIGYTGLGTQGQGVQLRVRDLDQLDDARQRLEELRNPLTGGVFAAAGTYEFDLTVGDNGLLRLSYSEAGLSERVRDIVAQSIEVIKNRVDELGTTEASVQRQGDDRILVESPGGDPERLKELVGKTAQLTFHMVVAQMSADEAQRTLPETGTIRFVDAEDPNFIHVVEDLPLMTGEDLDNATAGFDQQTNEPVVDFALTPAGARKFAKVTGENVGRLFAIVLDDEVISAPVIREAIPQGRGQISGSFTVESANDLAILLRAGSLPARLTIVEERSVGPGLGADSIEAGKIAAVIGTIAIVVFMIAVYGFFGVIANVAVIVNVIMIIALLTAFGFTLTLPGIAGIVLTVGMAVDSNVLIYERIREEARHGRTAIAAIDTGFNRALGTIVDANVTTLIAAVVLAYFGSGPIRGFAVTYMIGLVTTLFTAFTFTRTAIAVWVAELRPKVVPI